MDDKTNIIGERIRGLRENKNLKQTQLAADTGFTNDWLSKVERGDHLPAIEKALVLADYFNVSLDYLLGRTDVDYYEKNALNIICKHIQFVSRNFAMYTSNTEAPTPKLLLSVSPQMEALLKTLALKDEMKSKIPPNVLDAWINGEIQAFLDEIESGVDDDHIMYPLGDVIIDG